MCFRPHVFSEFVESDFGDASPSGPTLVTGAIDATVATLAEHELQRIEDTEKGEITSLYLHKIEEKIKHKAEFWLWTHRRWKHKK